MAEHADNLPSFSSEQRIIPTEPSISKPRKKRKWDQPDQCLIPSGVVSSGLLSVPTVGYPSVCLPGIMPTCVLTQTPLMQLQAAAVVQKLIQPKIHEDLVIGREIVINDADSAMRYKLTKRQTQEEIQKCTGAVVITRGKYRPPNATPDGEKPLYLHISSGAHLKETAERVVAVDRAAAMIEDMLKQVTQPLSTCVYVGFDADPSLNIVARIRGPNDQYINHIIHETGATVVLRGDRSGCLSRAECEEGQQRLHLFLTSNNQKSLEDARLLAENLMDTISRECGVTRVTSSKLYGAVPPPRQLLVGVQSSGLEMHSNLGTNGSLVCSATTGPGISNSLVVAPAVTAAFPFGQGAETGPLLPSSCSQTNRFLYSQPVSSSITSYSGYTGIYPQATPFQQVALAAKQSHTVTSPVASATLSTGMMSKSSSNAENRPSHKRKFQEAPTTLIAAAGSQQCPALHAPMKCSSSVERKSDTASVASTSSPSSRSMLPPPPPLPSKFPPSTPSLTLSSMLPPKATSSITGISTSTENNISTAGNISPVPVPDTLVKLMEYGDDDDDNDYDESDENELVDFKTNPSQIANTKPFWAA